MIAIINYGAGNLPSVERALNHLGVPCRVTDRPLDIFSADRLIFPGVGAAGSAMETLASRGLDRVIHEAVSRAVPFLGICLGAQIILGFSEEDRVPCLGLIPGNVRRFPPGGLKIPHMGWNDIVLRRPHPVLAGLGEGEQFYFVHSFYPGPDDEASVIADTEYGTTFPSVIGKDNVIAVQFHPEKSGPCGLRLLKNFAGWDGRTG